MFQGKLIVITGGNSGIGFATAEKIVNNGGTPIIVGKDSKAIAKAIDKLGDKAKGYVCDVSQIDEIKKLFAQIASSYDEIHGIVANAGNAILEPVLEVTPDSFDKTVNTNFKGVFFTVQQAVPLMKSGGSIVLTSSLAAYQAFANAAIYSATKAALISLAATMALELAKFNIRVNSVSPGTVITPIFDKLGMSKKEVADFISHYKQKISLERPGSPTEIANVISFLLSNESSFVTGTDILADGGLANCVK